MDTMRGHELAGSRLVGELPSSDMVALWREVTSGIVKYGFVIEYRDLEPPRTGIFDGLRIVIDPDVGFEMQCFLLLHLLSTNWPISSTPRTKPGSCRSCTITSARQPATRCS